MSAWDAIVIGGGHNGLVAGAYLARAGARTIVLEARSKTGGAAATDAPWPEAPEINVTRLSYVMSLMPPGSCATWSWSGTATSCSPWARPTRPGRTAVR
jgi:phytoene dehydrogenase-like protein